MDALLVIDPDIPRATRAVVPHGLPELILPRRLPLRRLEGELVWSVGPRSLRAVGLSRLLYGKSGRWVVSGIAPSTGPFAPVDRYLARHADALLMSTEVEATRFHPWRLMPYVVRPVGYSVEESNNASAIRVLGRQYLKEAIWAFDILKYTRSDLSLHIADAGSSRMALERFAHAIAGTDYRIHFEDCPAAKILWWLDPRDAAFQLSEVSPGTSIVAYDMPEFREFLGNRATYVPRGNVVALASMTKELLTEPESFAHDSVPFSAPFPPRRDPTGVAWLDSFLK